MGGVPGGIGPYGPFGGRGPFGPIGRMKPYGKSSYGGYGKGGVWGFGLGGYGGYGKGAIGGNGMGGFWTPYGFSNYGPGPHGHQDYDQQPPVGGQQPLPTNSTQDGQEQQQEQPVGYQPPY